MNELLFFIIGTALGSLTGVVPIMKNKSSLILKNSSL